jgi:hypothetical protein
MTQLVDVLFCGTRLDMPKNLNGASGYYSSHIKCTKYVFRNFQDFTFLLLPKNEILYLAKTIFSHLGYSGSGIAQSV